MNKLIRTSKTADTIVKIVGTVTLVCAIVSVIFAVLVLIFGEKMYEAGSLTLELDFIKLYLSEPYQTVTPMMNLYSVAMMISSAIGLGIVSWNCSLLRKILSPMMEGRPFDAAIPGHLKKASWIVLVGGALLKMLEVVTQFFITLAYPLDQIFASDAIQSWSVMSTTDYSFVLIFLVLLLLSYVFSYGVKLQQESDETL